MTVGAALALALAQPAFAQHEQHVATPFSPNWVWTAHGQVWLNANLQTRKFTDFYQVESQNWFMVTGARRVGRVGLSLEGMVSLEPFTLRRLGSAQVFQTGETLDDAPLVDYQHPHDLLLRLGAKAEWSVGSGWTMHVAGGPLGEPALGPTAFMHRPSAGANPTAPLSHHNLDSTHVTHGVLTVGFSRRGATTETSTMASTAGLAKARGSCVPATSGTCAPNSWTRTF